MNDKPKPGPGRPRRETEAAVGEIFIRTTLARKAHYVRAAQAVQDRSLSKFITEEMDKVTGYKPT